ncbi:cobalamin synthesis protein cobW-like protein [Ruminococcaceae bacterium R-25]|nr:cobalamin synthesis protein cobW-like protein [Ruminococcaceae bacterium R-25]SUQ21862.1 Cobalamin synthesis protein cobW C-terminal domain-containing protein [Oscillospiraceae bacterium]
MTKVDIFSGFLGAGKTTLIKKLIADGYNGQKLVLIENEFGQIGIDGGFLKESGINITEMNSGCICCSLVGDFGTALKDVIEQFAPDRILIEPSGVGKLSDVVAAVKRVEGTEICGTVTVIDASKCRIYLKNFKEFYENQIKYAGTIILSRTGNITQEKLDQAIALIREINDHSQIITTPWDDLSGVQILKAIEEPLTAADMAAALLEAEQHELEHAHHHHDHGEDCDCEECRHHHHDHDDDDDDDDEHEHHHHHHDHDDDDHDEHEHHHHHDHDDDDDEHEHEHHHHHHDHHADEVFDSIGFETSKKFTKAQIEDALKALDDTEKYGMVLRSKGIVAGEDGSWIHFDFVPEEVEVRTGTSDVTGKIVVIGSGVKKDAVKELFGI